MNPHLLNYYEAIEQASADMLQAARAGNWDEVVKLEGACVLLISQLKHARSRASRSRWRSRDEAQLEVAHHAAHPGQRRRDPPPGRALAARTWTSCWPAAPRRCTERRRRCSTLEHGNRSRRRSEPASPARRATLDRVPRHAPREIACAAARTARRQRAGDAHAQPTARAHARRCGRWTTRARQSASAPTPTTRSSSRWSRPTRRSRWPTSTASSCSSTCTT